MRPISLACVCFSFLILPLQEVVAEAMAVVTPDESAGPTGTWEMVIQPNSVSLPNGGSLVRVAAVMQAGAAQPLENQAGQAAGLPVVVPQPVRRPSYIEAYRSIPFLRSEYEANPAYRHEAAMELLFNQLRPVTIHKHVDGDVPAPNSAVAKTCLPPPSAGVKYQLNYYYPRHSSYRHPHSWACRCY